MKADLFGQQSETITINGKRCSKCRKIRPVDTFYVDKKRKDGRHPQCRYCVISYQKEWASRPEVKEKNRIYQRDFSRKPERREQIKAYRKNPANARVRLKARLKNHYKMTLEQYDAMMALQNNACAICRTGFSTARDTHLDHCHSTGRVRGILCRPCNHALGCVRDDPKVLKAMIYYLQVAR